MKMSWRCGKPYDVIRAARDSYVESQISMIVNDFGARQCQGYPNHYVTPSGDVYSTHGRRMTKLRPGTKPGGYKFVGMGSGKYEMVHRLVAMAFIDNPLLMLQVNHKDWDKSNNDMSNLEWVSASENISHALVKPGRILGYGSNLDLTEEQIHDIRFGQGKYRDIGARNGVSAQTVCNMRGRKGTRKKT
jgi:hypothetical protein